MKWLSFLLALVLLIPFSYSEPCDTILVTPNELCQMLTPVTNATTYQLFNSSGSLIDSGNLSVFNNSLKYFNFSQPEGYYLALLDDNLTKQIHVDYPEDAMASSWLAIILALGIMAFLYGYFSFQIKSKSLIPLKLLLFFLALSNGFMVGLSSYVIASNPGDASAFGPVATGLFVGNGIGFIAVVWLYAIYLIKRGVTYEEKD
jgi:hypothetical protein